MFDESVVLARCCDGPATPTCAVTVAALAARITAQCSATSKEIEKHFRLRPALPIRSVLEKDTNPQINLVRRLIRLSVVIAP